MAVWGAWQNLSWALRGCFAAGAITWAIETLFLGISNKVLAGFVLVVIPPLCYV